MIKILIVAMISIYTNLNLCSSSNRKDHNQTGIEIAQDTTKYLKDNFVRNKAEFQHKELKYLIAALKLNIKSYNFVWGRKRGEVKGISIFFETKALIRSKMDQHIRVKTMYISFEKPVSLYTDVTTLYNQSKGTWLPADEAFYGKQIVKDIYAGE